MAQSRRFSLKLAVIVLLAAGIVTDKLSATAHETELSTRTLRSMARAYMAFGKYDKAHILASQALQQARSGKTDAGELALCLIDMGTVCSYEGLLNEARQRFEEGAELQKQALFESHPYVAHTLRMLSAVCRRQGDLEQAQSCLSQAIEIMLRHCGLQDREMAPFILESANLQFAQGQMEQAEGNYRSALDMYEQYYGSEHLMTADVLEQMSKFWLACNNFTQAQETMSQSLAIKSRIFGRYHPMLIDGWLTMARLSRMQGQMERCEYYLAKTEEAAALTRNAVTLAQVYEQINRIRKADLVAAAF